MNVFTYVQGSHEYFPEDQYTKEALTLCFDGKFRVVYVRKILKNGGMFWDVCSMAVTQKGEKKYLKAFSQDSKFLEEDIKAYLESREWEKGGSVAQKSDQLPF